MAEGYVSNDKESRLRKKAKAPCRDRRHYWTRESWVLEGIQEGCSYADGTYPVSCKDYRMPSAPYTYSGYTGDGEYWIKPVGTGAPFKVTCDMTQDGGGWTLIGKFDGTTDTTLTAAYRVLVPYTQVKMSLNGTTTDKMITCHASAATGFAANNTAGVNCSVPDTDGKLYSVRVLQIGTNGTGNYGLYSYTSGGLIATGGCNWNPGTTYVWGRHYNGTGAACTNFGTGQLYSSPNG